MNVELQDLFDVVNRLDALRSQPPRPLAHLADCPRDGPGRHPEPFRGPKRVTGASAASQRPLRYSYHSKGLES